MGDDSRFSLPVLPEISTMKYPGRSGKEIVYGLEFNRLELMATKRNIVGQIDNFE
jgi:hypothetical protein